MLAACGGGAADVGSAPGRTSDGPGAGTAAEQVYARLNSLDAGAREAAIAGEKKEGELSLYSSVTEAVAGEIAKDFTNDYGIKVNVFRGTSETIMQRALQEGKAGRPGADVIQSNIVEMTALAGEGQFGEYKGPTLANVPDHLKFDH